MISVVLLGTGNVSQNLYSAFSGAKGVEVEQVVGRSAQLPDFIGDTTNYTNDFNKILAADVYIIAVSDNAISEVSLALKKGDGIVVHTSGATSMEILSSHQNRGVFYPLQTFTKGKMLSFETIPICIEASADNHLQQLEHLGKTISNNVLEINSEKRNSLHVSAVFANNFTNYLYALAEEICVAQNLDFSILKPLINETAAKIASMSPKKAQTGPAKRGDLETVHSHLQTITDKHQREIYILLSNAIKEQHGKEL
ncbi:MAG: DUF2520 domain-containing protein [Maribacter sp.]